MSYYSTDSEEHLVNIGAIEDPEIKMAEEALMDWWFEEPIDLDELDPEVEAHNDEIMERDYIHQSLLEVNDDE